MNLQSEKAARFRALHEAGQAPLVLYNAWDAGSARAVAQAGAGAVATSSWAVAAAQGYEDGEAIPLDLAARIAGRIASVTDLPVTADVEGGYAEAPDQVAANIARFVEAGVVGINFEDRRVHAEGLYGMTEQVERIAAVRRASDDFGVSIFINARTDLFFGARGDVPPSELMAEALDRAAAYASAGADGLFVPGLADASLIAELCATVDIPVNIMVGETTPPLESLAGLGVRRISFGPGPYIAAMEGVKRAAGSLFAKGWGSEAPTVPGFLESAGEE